MTRFVFSDLAPDAYLARVAEARRTLADPNRPRYHFSAPANWLNDPNGLIQWRGWYHMFYQHIPDDPADGAKWWGHAASRDLIHWEDRPLALAPTPGTADRDGIWSGCCLAHAGQVYALYTGFRLTSPAEGGSDQRPCLARALDDDLNAWQVYSGNPLMSQPAGVRSGDFRDHTAWQEGKWWYQGIGASINGARGAVQLYRSRDLYTWEYRGSLAEGDPAQNGWMWECPSFFALDGRHVLITSPIPGARAIYLSGDYADERFHAQLQGGVDAGGCFYAPQTFITDDGRRIIFGWLWEDLPPDYARRAGWAGMMSLPRVLSLDADGRLLQVPAAECEVLRGEHWKGGPFELCGGEFLPLPVRGSALELQLRLRPGRGESGVALRCSADGAQRTLVGYRPGQGLFIERRDSTALADAKTERKSIPLVLEADGTLDLRIFLDHSVVEAYAGNGRAVLTSRIYPDAASEGVQLYSTDGAQVEALDIWQCKSIW
ncbi:MAG: glycoside hydrolase family 32 protein [Chloroflexi bacterium]|nr:glycoside hydrolase family 32 protein [Chloroflexota bacterium]